PHCSPVFTYTTLFRSRWHYLAWWRSDRAQRASRGWPGVVGDGICETADRCLDRCSEGYKGRVPRLQQQSARDGKRHPKVSVRSRSEEHTSELQSLRHL